MIFLAPLSSLPPPSPPSSPYPLLPFFLLLLPPLSPPCPSYFSSFTPPSLSPSPPFPSLPSLSLPPSPPPVFLLKWKRLVSYERRWESWCITVSRFGVSLPLAGKFHCLCYVIPTCVAVPGGNQTLDRTTAFEALQHSTSVKDGAHTRSEAASIVCMSSALNESTALTALRTW